MKGMNLLGRALNLLLVLGTWGCAHFGGSLPKGEAVRKAVLTELVKQLSGSSGH